MKYPILIACGVLLLVGSAIGTDDGIRIGHGNETETYLFGTTEAVGSIFQYGGGAASGEDVESSLVWLLSMNVPRIWKVALLQLTDTVGGDTWTLRDTTDYINVSSSSNPQWVKFTFQLGYELFPSDDSLYALMTVSAAGGGTEAIEGIDSTAYSYPILGGSSEKAIMYSNGEKIDSIWAPVRTNQSYGVADQIGTFWVYYGDAVGPAGQFMLIGGDDE